MIKKLCFTIALILSGTSTLYAEEDFNLEDWYALLCKERDVLSNETELWTEDKLLLVRKDHSKIVMKGSGYSFNECELYDHDLGLSCEDNQYGLSWSISRFTGDALFSSIDVSDDFARFYLCEAIKKPIF